MFNKNNMLVCCNDCNSYVEIEWCDVDDSGHTDCDCGKLIEWDNLDEVTDEFCWLHISNSLGF